MLVLTRNVGERILLGSDVRITVCTASDGRARIGIEAPISVRVMREELVGKKAPQHRNRPFSEQYAQVSGPSPIPTRN